VDPVGESPQCKKASLHTEPPNPTTGCWPVAFGSRRRRAIPSGRAPSQSPRYLGTCGMGTHWTVTRDRVIPPGTAAKRATCQDMQIRQLLAVTPWVRYRLPEAAPNAHPTEDDDHRTGGRDGRSASHSSRGYPPVLAPGREELECDVVGVSK
jgi:hypothetical protein